MAVDSEAAHERSKVRVSSHRGGWVAWGQEQPGAATCNFWHDVSLSKINRLVSAQKISNLTD